MIAYVVLHMAVKEFLTSLENQWQCAAESVSKALKDLLYLLIMFITAENMSCIHTKE